jgi:hypothetical protein
MMFKIPISSLTPLQLLEHASVIPDFSPILINLPVLQIVLPIKLLTWLEMFVLETLFAQ